MTSMRMILSLPLTMKYPPISCRHWTRNLTTQSNNCPHSAQAHYTSASSWWRTSSLGPMWSRRHRLDCRRLQRETQGVETYGPNSSIRYHYTAWSTATNCSRITLTWRWRKWGGRGTCLHNTTPLPMTRGGTTPLIIEVLLTSQLAFN